MPPPTLVSAATALGVLGEEVQIPISPSDSQESLEEFYVSREEFAEDGEEMLTETGLSPEGPSPCFCLWHSQAFQ